MTDPGTPVAIVRAAFPRSRESCWSSEDVAFTLCTSLNPPFPPCARLQLALKHRKNKNGGQRVVVFNGSPIDATPEELKQLGTLMRRNNVRWLEFC